jgi:hypothetical protein
MTLFFVPARLAISAMDIRPARYFYNHRYNH